MSFDFSTLVTDRSQADLDTLRALLAVPLADWTAEQLAEFNQALSKGAYNYTDLNRVTACMDYLNEVLTGLGYETGYQKIRITHQQDPDNPLPGEYTRLEYIESAGAQYINTGIIPSSKTKIVVDFQVTKKTAENNDVFGVVGQFAFRQYMNNDFFRTVSGSFADFSSDVSIFSRHTVVKTMESTVIDDIYSASTLPSTVVNHLLLFAYSSGESIYNYGYLRMYSCAIYDDDRLVRNYIPCVDSNGVAGLYDTISKQFYSSSGTAEFLAGAYLTDDPNTLLLLHGESLEDTSGYRVPIVNDGVTVSDAQSKFGGGSLYFDGDSHFLTVQNLAADPLVDFTVDFWAYVDGPSSQTMGLFEANNYQGNGCELELYENDIYLWAHGAQPFEQVPYTGFGKWTHIALIRNSGTFYLYLDGVRVAYGADNGEINSTPFRIGSYTGENSYLHGYIDEFRVSNVARWTQNFTPPSKPYGTDDQPPAVDPYLWYEDNIPTIGLLDAYIANVDALKKTLALPEDAPDVPPEMDKLTYTEANNIEKILNIIHSHLISLQFVFMRAGTAWAISGGPGYYFMNGG